MFLNAFNYSKNICKSFFISGSTSLIKDFVIQFSHTQIIEDVYSAIFILFAKYKYIEFFYCSKTNNVLITESV